jgi:hypothetical protein
MSPNEPQLSFEVLRAQHGDCLLLHYGTEIVLIDGGPSGVYEDTLLPRIDALVEERGEPLWLRMIMVSHIDDDHIVGLAEMFADAREREVEQRGPKRWQAGEMWFNAFGALTRAGGTASPSGVRAADIDALLAKAPGTESRAVAAGVKTGNALYEDAMGLDIPINESAGGGLVAAGKDGATVIDVVPGLTFTVLAPSSERLEKLQKKWEKWEQDHPRADAEAAANLDRSVFNLSSIVVLAQANGRSLLLTGDAGSDDVLEGLKLAGLLADGGPPLTVDVLKLPHHGSVRNVNAEFFARVRAPHYVISANGRDGNPDNQMLTLLCDARLGDDEPWTLWLTYGETPGDGKPGLHERLSAFFADRKDVHGQDLDVRFASDGQAHTISLPAAD